jgi:multisubunit Na+/H+ antiporter MnhF subunit
LTAGEVAALALLLGVFLPAVWMASRGEPAHRLVGLEFAGIAAIMTVTLLAVAWQRDGSLIVPLALALVAFPGTLVYTRLLVRKR